MFLLLLFSPLLLGQEFVPIDNSGCFAIVETNTVFCWDGQKPATCPKCPLNECHESTKTPATLPPIHCSNAELKCECPECLQNTNIPLPPINCSNSELKCECPECHQSTNTPFSPINCPIVDCQQNSSSGSTPVTLPPFECPIVDCQICNSSCSMPVTLPPLECPIVECLQNSSSSIPFTSPPLHCPTESDCLPKSFLPISIIIIIISNILSCGLTFILMKWINGRKHVVKDEEKNEQGEKKEAEWDEEEKEENKEEEDTLTGANIVPMRDISGPFANAAAVREANLSSSADWEEEEKENEENNTLMGTNLVQMREFNGDFANSAAVQAKTSSLETIFEIPIARNRETLYFDAESNV